MRQRTVRTLALTGLLGILSLRAASAQDVTANPTSLLWGRQFTEWFYFAETDSLFSRMAESQKESQTPANLLEFLGIVQQQGGIEEDILSEEVKPDSAVAGGYRYLRRVKFSNLPDMVIQVVWVLSPEHKIAGFNMQPEQNQ